MYVCMYVCIPICIHTFPRIRSGEEVAFTQQTIECAVNFKAIAVVFYRTVAFPMSSPFPI